MRPYLKTKDHSVSGEEFQLLYNEELDMLITDPRPEELEKYYESDAYISHTDANKTLADKLYQAVKKLSLFTKVMMINKFADNNKTLLDVGAGTGDFLLAARRRGWETTGVEPNHDARMRAREKKIELLSNTETLVDNKYQVVTLWHVLEHIPDLESQIIRLKAYLEDEGTLVIAVPNFKSYDAEHYKEFWAGYDVPRHLWHFSRTSIEKLFAKYGMEVAKTKPLVFDAFYVSLLSEKYKTGRQNFINAFYHGVSSNIMSWLTKEPSSIIYIIKKEQKTF